MSPKFKAAVLWMFAVVLLFTWAWAANLTLFNWWASSGPPTEHPEIYKSRGNVFFALSWGLFLAFALVIWNLIRQYRKRRRDKLP
jgi:hypothetical protein